MDKDFQIFVKRFLYKIQIVKYVEKDNIRENRKMQGIVKKIFVIDNIFKKIREYFVQLE